MILSVVGLSHRTASVDQRAPFQIQRAELSDACLAFQRATGAEEAVVVATCNRVELYRVQARREDWRAGARAFFAARGVGDDTLAGFDEISYTHIGAAAARHLFRVTAGMDSMVLGEEQISGQVHAAYSAACRVGTPGKLLHKLFHHAFRVGKRVRAETPLGAGVRSVPGAAVEVLYGDAAQSLGDAAQSPGDAGQPPRALVIGANETTEVVLNHLRRHAIPTVLINRTRAHADELAMLHDVTVSDWADLNREMTRATHVFTATTSPDPVITVDRLRNRPSGQPLLIADLSVPHDVAPDVATLPGVEVHDLDRLRDRLKALVHDRFEHLPTAQGLVEQQVEAFLEWLHAQLFAGGIEALKQDLHREAADELDRFRQAFHDSEVKALEAFSHALIKRFLKAATHHAEPLGGMVLSDPIAVRFDPAALELELPDQSMAGTRSADPRDPTVRLSCREIRARKAKHQGASGQTDTGSTPSAAETSPSIPHPHTRDHS